MSPDKIEIWENLNRQYLLTEIELVHLELKKYLSKQGKLPRGLDYGKEQECLESELRRLTGEMESPSTVMKITNLFGLTEFEKKILLLCAGLDTVSLNCNCCGIGLLGVSG